MVIYLYLYLEQTTLLCALLQVLVNSLEGKTMNKQQNPSITTDGDFRTDVFKALCNSSQKEPKEKEPLRLEQINEDKCW